VRYPRLGVPVRAMFFDFDGVLWDSEVAALQSWQETFAEHGHRMSLDVFATRLGTLGGTDPGHCCPARAAPATLARAAVRMNCSASSVNAIISDPFRRMPPMAAMPPALAPPPTPRTTRQPVSTLSDETALARIVGGRSCRSATSGKNEMRSVSAARYAISVQTSRNSGL
jgi:hypothetical protein